MKSGTGRAFMADHKRKAVAACAPYIRMPDGAVNCRGVIGHSLWQPNPKRSPLPEARPRPPKALRGQGRIRATGAWGLRRGPSCITSAQDQGSSRGTACPASGASRSRAPWLQSATNGLKPLVAREVGMPYARGIDGRRGSRTRRGLFAGSAQFCDLPTACDASARGGGCLRQGKRDCIDQSTPPRLREQRQFPFEQGRLLASRHRFDAGLEQFGQ